MTRLHHTSHHRHNPGRGFGNTVTHPADIEKKLFHEEKIFRWIATHGQFREDHHIRFGFPGFTNPPANGTHISFKVTNHRIHLDHRQSKSHDKKNVLCPSGTEDAIVLLSQILKEDFVVAPRGIIQVLKNPFKPPLTRIPSS
jgi:hypothetical protein